MVNLTPVVSATSYESGELVAEEILNLYNSNGRLSLGAPWGTSPIPVFRALAQFVKDRNATLSYFHLIVMDEFVRKINGKFDYVDPKARYSGHYHIEHDFLELLPERARRQINVHFPDPSNPENYEELIKSFGGVDIFLVAAGANDGHVAMNGHGTPLESRTRVFQVPETVRQYNFQTNNEAFGNDFNNVPQYGITVGLRTMLDSKQLIFVAYGENKRPIVAKLLRYEHFDPEWPVTFLAEATEKTKIYIDRAASPV